GPCALWPPPRRARVPARKHVARDGFGLSCRDQRCRRSGFREEAEEYDRFTLTELLQGVTWIRAMEDDPTAELPQDESLPLTRESGASTPSLDGSPARPERIGHYRILRQIGEGGMGVVYEAEQEAPIRRRVALKLIRWGMDSKQVLARFEAERQALALLSHPN